MEELCGQLPEEIVEYMRYVRQLQHGEMPQYTQLRQLFRRLARKEGHEYDNVFDWTVLWHLQHEGPNHNCVRDTT